jgi:hemolysin III
MSVLFHSVRDPELKRLFKVLDHIAIYLLIVGTYTPFTLIGMDNESGGNILAIVWGLAIVGIASELFLSGLAVKTCQILIYLGMGWACAMDLNGVRAALPEMGFFWLLSGGIAYTAGIVFYVLDELNWLMHAHGIWHLFVLTGSVCHFIAIIQYVR